MQFSTAVRLFAEPQTPAQSQSTMRLADENLEIVLVAAEPLVESPVAIAWDADERLYVAEMIDYPAGPGAGRIKRLTDKDGDGRYETATVFADKLSFPNSVLAWRDGVLVTAAPDLIFLRDADGDGQAEERRVIVAGYGEGNTQLRANGLFWGLDNWVYGANGRSDGEMRNPADASAKRVSIRRRDFRIHPDAGRFEAIAGPSQFGHARNDWGHRFLSWNTIPVRQAILDPLPHAESPPPDVAAAVANITDPADNGRLFPASRPPMTFNRESVEFFNAGCGLTVFRGTALGEKYYGNALVCEPLTNIVHRRLLVPAGSTFVAERADAFREFLSSTDAWFHPVNLTTGPDGALYVVDFYRRWVEHPNYVPEATRPTIDWREGAAHGRIWRIRRRALSDTAKDAAARPLLLNHATTADLVQALTDRNGWRRDTAQRLIVERQDREAISLLNAILREAASPAACVHALYCLDGLTAIDNDVLIAAMDHADPRVREHGVRLASRRIEGSAEIRRAVLERAGDDDARVRLQMAASLVRFDTAARHELGLRLVSAADDPWVMRTTVEQLEGAAWPVVQSILRDRRWSQGPSDAQVAFLLDAARAAARVADDAALSAIVRSEELSPDHPSSIDRLAVMVGLAEGRAGSGRTLRKLFAEPPPELRETSGRWQEWMNSAIDVVNRLDSIDSQRELAASMLAVRLLAHGESTAVVDALVELAAITRFPALQATAARALAERGEEEPIARLLDSWPRLATSVRREILSAMLRSPQSTAVLVSALETEKVQPNELDAASRDALRQIRSTELKPRIERLLKAAQPAPRAAVLKRYQAAASLSADGARGEKLFVQHCAACHVFRGQGHRVGPDLSGVAARTKEILLADLLDPSAQVASDFTSHTLTTKDGQVLTGLLVAETDRAVTLRRNEGVEETVQRQRIEELRSTGRSLMPDGFEQLLGLQDVADLLEFLRAAP
jgi:putative membrane-bound dehydrogenase-like protein